jgi:hypothetical protein
VTSTSLKHIVLSAALLFCIQPAGAASVDPLQAGFLQPPDEARIMMRWWWFGPAVTHDRLAREMELMKAGGIGGFEVQPTYPLALDGQVPGLHNLDLMGPEYLEALHFTAQKAKDLGLRMDLTLGSGWPYGGPQFPRSEAAGCLVIRNAEFAVGQKTVPVPEVREGDEVFAAFVGPLPNVPEGQCPYQEVPIRDGLAYLPESVAGLTTASGNIYFTFYISSRTGMQVKRAANKGEGYVIDHYAPAVIQKFITDYADPAIQACAPNPPYAVFCDSLEVGGEDWTPSFLDEFKARRGYDLRPWLPALFTDIGPKTLDIRLDWGRTLTELFNDYFDSAFKTWAEANGTRFRIQGYGSPPAALYSYAYADLDEAEGYNWHGFDESRWAASASHLLGRPVTSSETWTWLHSAVYLATPLDMKAEADRHFLQGINQLIGHGWPYTANGIEYPGWRFYAAAVLNEKNPWWIVMPDVAKYMQRVSFMMRQGVPAQDVALYLSNSDIWANFRSRSVSMNATVTRLLGRDVIPQILDAGFNLDFMDDQLLDMRGKVQGDKLAFGDVTYRVVVLPGVERMPISTLKTLNAFADAGGLIVATGRLPDRAPGFLATEADHQTVRSLASRLFEGPNAKGVFVASDSELGGALAGRLQPDLKCQPAEPDIGFVHRKTDAADIYFVANTANESKSVEATFRVAGRTPECWNPLTGQIEPARTLKTTDNDVTIQLDLDAYGSTLVVFSERHLPEARPAVLADTPAVDLSKDWTVRFGPDYAPVRMADLRSWTDDPATRHFSGVATYEKTVTVPEALLKDGLRVALSLGQARTQDEPAGRGGNGMRAMLEAPVREAAVVTVNGRRAGAVWCPPYRVDVTGLLKPGDNTFRIEVANLAVNYMSDFERHPLPDYQALKAEYGDRFQPQGMNLIQPTTSGLLGPIQLVPVTQTHE